MPDPGAARSPDAVESPDAGARPGAAEVGGAEVEGAERRRAEVRSAADSLDAVGVLVGLGRALAAAGVPVGPDRVTEAVRALAELDPARRADVYWAGRLTFCAGPEDLVRYDAVFATLFSGLRPRLRRRPATVMRHVPLQVDGAEPGEREQPGEEQVQATAAAASTVEVLRHKDIATLTAAERAALHQALAAFGLPGEARRSRRWTVTPSGRIDPHRTVRALLQSGGEPYRLHRRRHGVRPRAVVLIVDVSGSMSAYADALLRFAHAASRRRAGRPGGGRTEVFTLGTRLTRVTRELSVRDPDAAMRAVGEQVPDWSGGTRLGALLGEFLDRWGQRGAARGAVVVVLSDGWERDDPAVLGRQMARLSRLAHRVVWSNPRRGRPGFAPLAAGLVAALPYVDDFVDGHSLAALERLARVVVGADARPSGSRSGGPAPATLAREVRGA